MLLWFVWRIGILHWFGFGLTSISLSVSPQSINTIPYRCSHPQGPRISFPLLVRGHDDSAVDTATHIDARHSVCDSKESKDGLVEHRQDAEQAEKEQSVCPLLRCNGVKLRTFHVRSFALCMPAFLHRTCAWIYIPVQPT